MSTHSARSDGLRRFATFACAALAACGSRGPIYDDPWFGRDANLATPDAATDAARSCDWEETSEGLSGGGLSLMTLDPADASRRTLFAVSGSRVHRSTDGGDTWILQGELEATPYGLAFDAATLVASTSDGVWASLDEGRTFAQRGLRGLAVVAVATAPLHANRIYAAIDRLGVVRSNDGGATWSAATAGLEGVVRAISVDPRDPDVLIASTILDASGGAEGQLARSTDGGRTWTEIDRTGGRWYDLARCSEDPDVIVAARRWGLFVSEDAGATFVPVPPVREQVFFTVSIDGPRCEHLIAFSSSPRTGAGVYVADDRATLEGPFTMGLAISPTARADPGLRALGGGRVVAATPSGPRVSDDGGRSYRNDGTFLGMAVTTLTQTNGVLWAGTYGNGNWSLRPDASRWTRLDASVLVNEYTFGLLAMDGATLESGAVLVGTWGDLYGRASGRTTFDLLPSDVGAVANVFAFTRLADGTIVAASQVHGAQRSDDGGASFVSANEGIVPWSTPLGVIVDLRAVASDDSVPGVVVAGGPGGGLWRSVDGARSWMPAGLAAEDIRTLVHSPALRTFTALVAGEGVYESGDGTSWREINDGLESLDVDGLDVDELGTRYLASGHRLYRLPPGSTRWEPVTGECAPRGARLPRVVEREDGTWLYVVAGLDGMARLRL